MVCRACEKMWMGGLKKCGCEGLKMWMGGVEKIWIEVLV